MSKKMGSTPSIEEQAVEPQMPRERLTLLGTVAKSEVPADAYILQLFEALQQTVRYKKEGINLKPTNKSGWTIFTSFPSEQTTSEFNTDR